MDVPLTVPVAVALDVFGDEAPRHPGSAGLLPELGTPWLVLAFVGARLLQVGTTARAPSLDAPLVVVDLVKDGAFAHLTSGDDLPATASGEDTRSVGWGFDVLGAPGQDLRHRHRGLPGGSRLFLEWSTGRVGRACAVGNGRRGRSAALALSIGGWLVLGSAVVGLARAGN